MSKEITNRFVGPNGEFQPTEEREKGTITIAYLQELLEWTFYHDNITLEEKKKNINDLEMMIENILGKNYPMKINYVRTWSKKLEEELNQNKNESN